MPRRGRAAPYILLAPFLFVFASFVVYPLLRSLSLSTERTFGPSAAEFVGLENYALLLGDPLFWKAARNTLVFTGGSLLLQLPARAAARVGSEPPGAARGGRSTAWSSSRPSSSGWSSRGCSPRCCSRSGPG
jgi:hypothetical protein